MTKLNRDELKDCSNHTGLRIAWIGHATEEPAN